MSPRTKTPAPLDDRSYWRRLKAVVHPDADSGDHELFLFLCGLEEHVTACMHLNDDLLRDGARSRSAWQPERSDHVERIPYDHQLGYPDEFVALALRAASIGMRAEEPYRSIFALLQGCPVYEHGRPAMRQCRGASYRQLAKIGHSFGLDGAGRSRLYELARSVLLSEAHAHHILSELAERSAA